MNVNIKVANRNKIRANTRKCWIAVQDEIDARLSKINEALRLDANTDVGGDDASLRRMQTLTRRIIVLEHGLGIRREFTLD